MVKQMAVFMENRKGRIGELTKVLKKNNIDLVTLSIADTKDFGILRCITRDNARAEQALRAAGFTVTTTELIGVEVADEPGRLAEVTELLEENDVNIEYLYSFARQSVGTGIILFKVDNEALALKALKDKGVKILEEAII
ncbi:MAG: ACT domain-containing protein [Clostridia bacterium]|jgi:hypothetical protein|nr:ACT domain-containing protein [Clostridia bacterium]